MKLSNKNQTAGSLHQAKGKIKETVGKLINDPVLETEGTIEKVSGKIQKEIGDIEKATDK